MIRRAIGQDVPRLVEMGVRFMETEYAGHMAPNPDALSATVCGMLEDQNALLMVIDDNGVRGVIGVMVYRHPFSGDMVASETFWWVDPEHRGGGVRLMREAERWAKNRGATKMQMGAPAGRSMDMFYTRMGYEQTETAFQRNL